MATYQISQCTVNDGEALSRNNMSAFWGDSNWRLSWKHTTLEAHIAEVAKRTPRNLLKSRATLRHQKAVEAETGRLLGYARWILPPSHNTTTDGEPAWPEAQVPAVGEDEEKEIGRTADAAIFNPDYSSSALDDAIDEAKKEILTGKTYLRLDYMAVHPENQRRGIGSALVRSGMKQADKMGLDIFILAYKAGFPVYKKLGFRVQKEVIQDDSMYGGDGEYGVWFMIYEHKSKSDA